MVVGGGGSDGPSGVGDQRENEVEIPHEAVVIRGGGKRPSGGGVLEHAAVVVGGGGSDGPSGVDPREEGCEMLPKPIVVGHKFGDNLIQTKMSDFMTKTDLNSKVGDNRTKTENGMGVGLKKRGTRTLGVFARQGATEIVVLGEGSTRGKHLKERNVQKLQGGKIKKSVKSNRRGLVRGKQNAGTGKFDNIGPSTS